MLMNSHGMYPGMPMGAPMMNMSPQQIAAMRQRAAAMGQVRQNSVDFRDKTWLQPLTSMIARSPEPPAGTGRSCGDKAPVVRSAADVMFPY